MSIINMGKNKKVQPKKIRVSSAKAGTGKKCDLNYFPPDGSVSNAELVRIVEAGKKGIPVSEYLLSEMFLGRLVRCGLVASDGVSLTATQRTADVFSGKLQLPSTREGSKFNSVLRGLKTATDVEDFDALIAQLAEMKEQALEQNAAKQESKAEKAKQKA